LKIGFACQKIDKNSILLNWQYFNKMERWPFKKGKKQKDIIYRRGEEGRV